MPSLIIPICPNAPSEDPLVTLPSSSKGPGPPGLFVKPSNGSIIIRSGSNLPFNAASAQRASRLGGPG
ncbi:hypothetical protein N7530_002957 [Penicillium desertorum]|uniref:Uncharacterized protein n=1 Tax=Penicillium desertorum TaxID=1303715 RepID=A0A9W9X4Q4_9EURO|nr:hypothetical protein N7530_002957 [Penicillium desertorum]